MNFIVIDWLIDGRKLETEFDEAGARQAGQDSQAYAAAWARREARDEAKGANVPGGTRRAIDEK